MKYQFVTIEREYGSGGLEIATRLSKACNIPVYGREILQAAANELSVTINQAELYEEKATNSFLYSLYMINRAQAPDPNAVSKESRLHFAEQQEIKKIADKGPAIFVGRCAAEALSDVPNVLNVFIHADKEWKLDRIMHQYGIPREAAPSELRRVDKRRSVYYNSNTAKKWTNVENYHLTMDSSKLGLDGCVALLEAIVEHREFVENDPSSEN